MNNILKKIKKACEEISHDFKHRNDSCVGCRSNYELGLDGYHVTSYLPQEKIKCTAGDEV